MTGLAIVYLAGIVVAVGVGVLFDRWFESDGWIGLEQFVNGLLIGLVAGHLVWALLTVEQLHRRSGGLRTAVVVGATPALTYLGVVAEGGSDAPWWIAWVPALLAPTLTIAWATRTWPQAAAPGGHAPGGAPR